MIRRAGADIVLTYWAAEVAGWLAGGHADVLRGHRPAVRRERRIADAPAPRVSQALVRPRAWRSPRAG